jgi:hypothetical protein
MKIKAFFLAGAIALPVQQTGGWQLLQFSGIEPNRVSFSDAGMSVSVDASASPIIYPLDCPRRVSRVEVSGRLSGLLRVDEARQGQAGNDDFSLKIGLVAAGDKTLSGWQKLFSADWIRTLFELAPEGTGVDRIYFLNAVQNDRRLGLQRRHPLSDLIHEDNVWLLDEPGDFSFSHTLDEPREVIAVWLSIDGDDSGSRYSTLITSLRLDGQDCAVSSSVPCACPAQARLPGSGRG